MSVPHKLEDMQKPSQNHMSSPLIPWIYQLPNTQSVTRSSSSWTRLVIFIRHVLDPLVFKVNMLIFGPSEKNTEQKMGIFLAPVIQMLINKTWFRGKKDDGVMHPEFFEDEMLSLSTLALVLTIVSLRVYFPLHGWCNLRPDRKQSRQMGYRRTHLCRFLIDCLRTKVPRTHQVFEGFRWEDEGSKYFATN